MYAVKDEVETIHLYVVHEQPKRPYTAFPLLCAFLCLVGMAALTLYSAQHPSYAHARLQVPAIPIALRVFKAQTPVIPTGIKTYPATYATGVLTFSNGSVIGQSVPAGFTVGDVATDSAVYVPPATPDGFGIVTVDAHAGNPGKNGNIAALAINTVIGSSLFIRNLTSFTGGQDAYSVKYVTRQDKLTATLTARNQLTAQISGYHYPCQETIVNKRNAIVNLIVNWRCQFVSYQVPAFLHVAAARLSGKNFIVDVWYIPRPVMLPLR